jgi:hypothetical protein
MCYCRQPAEKSFKHNQYRHPGEGRDDGKYGFSAAC